MEYTNKLNLPTYLVDWLKTDSYDHSKEPNTLSATGLMKPLRAATLTARHGDNLEMDVSELIASRYGSAVHDSIERVSTSGVSKEVRTVRQVVLDGTTFSVTGKYDLLVEEAGVHTIRDIKTTSVWSYIFGGKDEDYRIQLSIYRWLLSLTHTVNPIAYIDFFFTDWQSSKARTEDNYPKYRIQAGYKIDLLSLEDTEAYIIDKLTLIKLHQKTLDDQLPLCTREELWQEDDTFAVYKIGGKRATKVCHSNAEAIQYSEAHNLTTGKGRIDHRVGKVKRCNYCSARPFCSQFKHLQEYKLID